MGEICNLFCCPPIPSKIWNKITFPSSLIPFPTYTIKDISNDKYKIDLTDKAEWIYTEEEKENLEVFYTRTSRGNKIACMFVKCVPDAQFTILYSQGNKTDLGQMSTYFLGLGRRINCNVFSYDHSGFGVSEGKPSEKNMYADVEAAFQAMRNTLGIAPEKIIPFGDGIGTAPTIHLASKFEVGGVILRSPITSAMRLIFPETKRTWFFDAFASIDKIGRVKAPVLVIHGTLNDVIDFSHGLAIHQKCPNALEPLWVEGAGIDDLELYDEYFERIIKFISTEVPSGSNNRQT